MGKTYWQVAAGSEERSRDYSEFFIRYGIAFVGAEYGAMQETDISGWVGTRSTRVPVPNNGPKMGTRWNASLPRLFQGCARDTSKASLGANRSATAASRSGGKQTSSYIWTM